MSNTTAFDIALDFASRGYPVLPVKVDKAPYTKHGVKDATTDEAQIREWGNRYPGCNWGMATGKPSGISVLDIDPRNGGFAVMQHLKREFGAIPQTVAVWTGGEEAGLHYYFRHPENDRLRNIAIKPGVDIKTTGGFVIIPGSVTANQYKFATDRGFDTGQTVAQMPQWIVHSCSRGSRDFDFNEEGVVKRGERNDFLASWAGTLRQRGANEEAIYNMLVALGKIYLEYDERDDDLDDEYRKVAASISKYEPGDPILGDPSIDPDVREEARRSERIVLGRVLGATDREDPVVIETMSLLREAFIDEPKGKQIFRHVRKLWQAGGVPSWDNIELSLEGDGDEIPAKYVEELLTMGRSLYYVGDAKFHVGIMRNGYVFREGARVCQVTLEKMREARGDANDHVAAASTSLLGLVDAGTERQVADGADLVAEVRDLYRKAADGELVMNEPTGFADLDAEIDGWAVAEIAIVAARPGHGKTAMTVDSSLRNAQRQVEHSTGKGVFYGSYEMSRRQIALRMACNLAQIDSRKVRTGQHLTPDEWERLEAAYKQLAALPIFVDDQSSPSPEQVCAKILAVHSHTKLSLVVIDYIELLGRSEALGKHVSKTEVLEEAIRQFKGLAKTLDCPVIVVCQLDRAVEKGANVNKDNPPMPRPSDLRWAGMAEQTANQIVFLCYDWQFHKSGVPYANPPDERQIRVMVPKARDGGVGMVYMEFVKRFGRFEEFGSQISPQRQTQTAMADDEMPWEGAQA